MNKKGAITVIALLAISSLALAEDKATTAPGPEAEIPAQEIADLILNRAATIGANCALEQVVNDLQTRDPKADKTTTNTTSNEDGTRGLAERINTCIQERITQMKAAIKEGTK